MKEKIIERIVEYFKENKEIFNTAIEELDSYNGYLGDGRYYEMEMLDEFYGESKPIDILQRAFFGYDEDAWNLDSSGNKEYGPFNPNREYFTFNGYGNLVSADYKDYTGHLDHYAIESMLENRRYIDTIEENAELQEMFDELEETEE